MVRTRFCERFGIEAPIVVAPMGPDLTGPELVAAVCAAGGFGILQAQLCPPPMLRQQIRHLRTLTSRPFGVNFVLHFPHRAGVGVCIEERVAALSFFWGDPAEFVAPAHAAGIAVFFFSSRRRHTRFDCDWSSTCALPISPSSCPLRPAEVPNFWRGCWGKGSSS